MKEKLVTKKGRSETESYMKLLQGSLSFEKQVLYIHIKRYTVMLFFEILYDILPSQFCFVI